MQPFLVYHPRNTAYQGYSQKQSPEKFKETKLYIAEPDTSLCQVSRTGTIPNPGLQRYLGVVAGSVKPASTPVRLYGIPYDTPDVVGWTPALRRGKSRRRIADGLDRFFRPL